MNNRETVNNIKFAHRTVTFAECHEQFSAFRFDSDNDREMTTCFAASLFSDGDDELYCELYDALNS